MNYNSLMNKPTINYRELIGDNTVSEVGGITEEEFDQLLDTDLSSYYTKAQIDDLFSRSFVYREKSGSIVTFDCPESTTSGITKVVSDIVAVQSGTGDPSPTNIRPISGWTACNVVRTGKNLVYKTISKATVSSNGEFVISSSINTDMQIAQVKKDKVYTITSDELFVGGFFTSEPTNGSVTYNNSRWADTPKTFTSPIDGYAAFRTSNGYATPQIELGTQSTPYETYSGNTYTINFVDGSSPLTCYGGELVNENGVQRLAVTHGYIASYNGETLPSTWISDRDVYAEGTTPTTGAEVVYELATPQTIQQDNLAIASSAGINNIWCDSGDITVKALDRIIQG